MPFSTNMLDRPNDKDRVFATGRQVLGENLRNGATKRAATRIALTAIIREGLIKPGELLPAEVQLAGELGVSLGTVQHAMRQLQERGLVRRRRGDGTRLTRGIQRSPSIWHGRVYMRETGQFVNPVDEDIELCETTGEGPWSDFLGRGEFVIVRRKIETRPSIEIATELYLAKSKFKSLLSIPISELKLVNLRTFLEDKFDVSFAKAENMIATTAIDELHTAKLKLDPSLRYFEISARSFQMDGDPISFQRLYIEEDRCTIRFDARR